MLLELFSLILISITPLPALPYVLYIIAKYGFLKSLYITIIASFISHSTLYFLGYKISKSKRDLFKIKKRLNKYTKQFNNINFKDIIILKLANLYITKITNIFLNLGKICKK